MSFESKPVKIEVPTSQETVVVAPEGLGVVLKVSPDSLESASSNLPTISIRVCSSKYFILPPSSESASLIYHISSNSTLKGELEIMIEHTADIETSEQAERMVFLVAPSSTDGTVEVKLFPKPGNFEEKKEHGSLITNELGFICVGAPKSSDISKNIRCVLCRASIH